MRLTFRRFLRTPKGLTLLALAALVAVGLVVTGPRLAMPGLAIAAGISMLVDAPILRLRSGRWTFPSGALLTGLIIAMVLTPQEPWYVFATTAAIAIVSKYVARARKANIFNPAALALVATFYLFDTGQSWWGALPDLGVIGIGVLVAAGGYTVFKVNKIPALLAFMGSYFGVATILAFIGDPARVAELFRTPDLQAVLYFGCFMLSDPPTSPPRPRDQAWFGAITGVASLVVFESTGAAHFLLAGLLVANAWEAFRRRARGSPR